MLVPFPHFHFATETCLKVGLPDGFGLALLFTSWVSLVKLLKSVSLFVKQEPGWTCPSLPETYLVLALKVVHPEDTPLP